MGQKIPTGAKYINRLFFCIDKAKHTEGKESVRWRDAAGLYQHLIECKLSHSAKVKGEKCEQLNTWG